MIYTITLNPAFDKTIFCENFTIGSLNRIENRIEDIAGKGINVSKVLRILGQKSMAYGFLGEDNAERFIASLNQLNIQNDFVILSNQRTRTNIKIIDSKNHHLTEINESGLQIKSQDMMNLTKKLLLPLTSDDYVIISGSLPLGANPSLYIHLISAVKKKTAKLIFDISGESLKQSLAYEPLLIKPNLVEMEELLGRKVCARHELIKAGKGLLAQGVKNILLSMGENGSYFFSEHECYRIMPIPTAVKSPVGAGDSQVAAFVYGLINDMFLSDILCLTSAVSTAMVSADKTAMPDLDLIQSFLKKVRLQRV